MRRPKLSAGLAIVLLAASCSNTSDELVEQLRENTPSTAQVSDEPVAGGPELDDHWHSAFDVYDCRSGSFLDAPLEDAKPGTGIHTHGDGLIHIHPFDKSSTGADATLAVFFDTVGASVDAAGLTLANGDSLPAAGETCDGQPALLQVHRFTDSAAASTIYTEDLGAVRFVADLDAFTLALAPLGAEVPPPPAAELDS